MGMPAPDVMEIESVVSKPYQDQIEAETTSPNMPWFFRPESALSRPVYETSYSGFSNTVFHHEDPATARSPMTALLLPLLFAFCDKANRPFSRLLRLRIGLFPRTMIEAEHHHPHVDFYQPHYNALYYVNDADGDTVVFNETFEDVPEHLLAAYTLEKRFTVAKRVTPKRGKMVGFEGKQYHASMHPMRTSHRIAIAFSFL